MLDPSRGLLPGVATKVADALVATGTARVHPFSVICPPGKLRQVVCQAIGTFTVFDGNLEMSADGQTTWSIFVAFDFVAAAIFVFDGTPGVSFRFNVLNLTQTVAPDIQAVLG